MELFNSWLVDSPIAYRGLFDKTHPENSLSAFEEAIKLGYPIAIDVRMICDGTLVVFSDEGLSRMTGNDGYLKFLKRSDLDILHIGGTKEKIPTFEEVLKFVNGRVPLLIDIKNDNKVGELEKNLIEALKGYNGKFAVASTNPYVLQYIHTLAPDIIKGQVSGYFKEEKIPFFKKRALKKLKFNDKISHPDFIIYEADKLPNRYVKKYKTLPLIAHPVKSQSEYLKVVKYCDNVIFQDFEPMI